MDFIAGIVSKLLGASWRTSIMGWIALVGSVAGFATAALDGNPDTSPSMAWEQIMTALVGVGLISAKDNRVSTKDVETHEGN